MITAPIGMGAKSVGKGTIGHIVQFVFPSTVTFRQSDWGGSSVHIPKPAAGTIETLTCIIVRVYGREDEEFIPDLGKGLILIFPTKLDMKFGCLKNNNIQGQAKCTQLPITVVLSMVVHIYFSNNTID
jgi:hypothetical protein